MAKQIDLPGAEPDEQTQELIDVANAYFEVAEHRNRLTKELQERKQDIAAAMNAMKKRVYTCQERGLVIKITPIGVKVTVSKVRTVQPGKKRGRSKKQAA